MIRVLSLNISTAKWGLKCGRCFKPIKKGEKFLKCLEIDEIYKRAYDKPINLDIKCGVREADSLDAKRINLQANKLLLT